MQHARQMSASSSASSFTAAAPLGGGDEDGGALLFGTTPTAARPLNGELHSAAHMEKSWSGESLAQLPTYDENRPRKHHRRTSLPLQNASGGPANVQPEASVAAAKAERKRFREALKVSKRRRAVKALTPATGTGDSGSATASGGGGGGGKAGAAAPRGRPRSDTLEEERERDTTTDASSHHEVTSPSFYSSTQYAAGPSGRNNGGAAARGEGEEGLTSSDEDSSSDRQTFDWDVRRSDTLAIARHRQHRSSFDDRTSSVRARRMRLAGESRPPPLRRESSILREAQQQPRRGSVDAALTAAAAASSSALSRLQIPSLRAATLKVPGLASPSVRSSVGAGGGKEGTPTYGTPTSTEVGVGSGTRRAQAKVKKRLRVNPAAEAALILGAGVLACYELSRSSEPKVQARVLELSWVLVASALYVVTRRRGDQGYIWTTDSRSFRQAGNDGALNALLFGPLLAASCVIATARQEALSFRSKGSVTPVPLTWLVEGPLPILQHQRGRPSATRSVLLGQCSLLSLQTLTSTILLFHLLASKLLRRPQDHAPISNWNRLRNFMVFEVICALLMECAREAAVHLKVPLWTDLARWELFTIALIFQNNLYSISRLARKSFTLGELGLVAGVGATLIMETINVTVAKIFPVITPYVKTYRLPTPLVIFQLALIVGAFMAGFLLSPLLYLSRHLAQKPVHRLRWPHKRDLHRRLLAGFFYLFVALFVVGVLGLWVRWLLVARDPWLWTVRFLVSGASWWARPALIVYWLALVCASVLSWQAIVVSAKRFRVVRTQGTAGSKVILVPPPPGSDAAARQEGSDPGAPMAGNKRASAAMVVRQLSGLGSAAGAAAAATETGGVTLKKAAHLSLNARRKFFHALAVLLFVPGIALDPAFSHLAFSLAFSAFIFAEYIRYYALYPFGATLHVFMAEFTDHKDAGPVILSHFYLLTGCASSLWLEGPTQISQQMGVLVLGVGDALASVVGRRYGRVFWPGSNKTMEGSAAFVGSILASAWVLRLIGWVADFSLPRFFIVLLSLGLLEGVSEQNDNLVLPLYSYIAMILLDV